MGQGPDVAIRRVAPDEWVDFLTLLGGAHGTRVDDHYREAWRPAFDFARNVALFVNGRMTGTATSGLVELTVPGPRTVTAACTGNLVVDPAAPLPGLARAVFGHQCRTHREEGLPFLVFSVTESMRALHFRLGSAPATCYQPLTLLPDRRPAPHGEVRELSLLDAELDDLHRRVAPTGVGLMVRERSWMGAVRRLQMRDGTPVAWGIHDDGRLTGYAIWRRTGDGTAQVEELLAEDIGGYRTLVGGLLADGPVELRHWRPDDALRWVFKDRAKAVYGGRRDALWLRLLDPPKALAARGYPVSGRLVLQVDDPFLPEAAGTFVLEATPQGAECRPCGEPADVRLGTGALAAMYLGGTAPGTLVAAGLAVPRDDRAARRLEALFAPRCVPWSGAER